MGLPTTTNPDFFTIPEEITYEEWENSIKVALSANRLLPFRVGDYLNYGEDRWGEDCWQALGSEYDIKTLMNWRWISRRFPAESGTRSPDIATGVYLALGAIREDERRYQMALKAIAGKWKITKAQQEALPYKPKRKTELKKAELAKDLPPEDDEPEEQANHNVVILHVKPDDWKEFQASARRILQSECDRTKKITPDMTRLAEFFNLSIGRS